MILNIPYWGAGVKPWELGSGHKDFNFTPSFSDKKLEVFCVFSSFHIAQMQVGLSEPHRVGQAREVKIKLTGSVPMQIDGEPWEQHPAEISLQHHTQVLYKNCKEVDDGDCSVDTCPSPACLTVLVLYSSHFPSSS